MKKKVTIQFNSRKAQRKQKRQQKKIHRQEHYLKKKIIQKPLNSPGKFVKRPADYEDQELEMKKHQNKKKKVEPSAIDVLSKERQKEKNEVKRLNSQIEKQRKKMLMKANEEEDKMIKKLEKQLGLKKAKNKNSYFTDDGLDYLLDICDRTTTEQIVAAERHLADVKGESDFEEDLAIVTGKELPKKKDKKKKDISRIDKDKTSNHSDEDSEMNESVSDMDGDDSEINDDEEMDDHDSSEAHDDESDYKEENESDEEPEEKPIEPKKAPKSTVSKNRIVKENDVSKVFSDDEVSHLSGDENDDLDGFSGDETNMEGGEEEKKLSKEKPDVWEDIYGRKRDKEGNIIKEEKGVYIPPHLRNKDSASEKELIQLKRQIKSVLNKLSGTNLHWACSSIEALYASHSRHAVNSSLTQLWTEATVGTAATPDRMVADHAALLSVLHANVATEIGAHFLQELTKKFDLMMQTPQQVEDKRLDNIVSCLAHLYSFKIFHATLLYDILSRLMDELSEKNIDCVLVALRSVGGVLRKEEPAALKEFIHDTQSKIAKINETAANGSRIKFLLDVLMAVKNNNLAKIPNYDPSYTEHLKKMTKAVIRKGNYVTPLNIRLEDLLKAEERGKWWVVGSAWEGTTTTRSEDKPKPIVADQRLTDLARSQRMNTDVRRSIFCVIMSAEDYMDAFEKLQHLGLKGQQEREIVHVLLSCCLQEKTFNPYYAVLARQLCTADRKYQLSIQYSVWDKIKDLESLSKQAMKNLAQFLVHLFMEKSLPLSVLKIIEFSDLNKRSLRFMRQILLAIIMNEDLQSTLEVFHRVSKSSKLHMFRESLRLFIQHFLIKNASKTELLSEDEMATLKDRSIEIDKILTMHESKLRF